jgi:hypothetical protein
LRQSAVRSAHRIDEVRHTFSVEVIVAHSLESLLSCAPDGSGYKVLEVLGAGDEGVVCVARNDVTGHKLVVKKFREPRSLSWVSVSGLHRYATGVTQNGLGLPSIQLLVHDERVEGVCYPWFPLYHIHPRVLAASDRMRRSVAGAFCCMQHFLMSQLQIGLWDAYADNFLLDRHGHWHFTDFGYGISPLHQPECFGQGYWGYALAMLLLSLHGTNIKHIVAPSSGYQYDRPCKFWMVEELDDLARTRSWIRNLVSEVRCQPASTFLEPDFYKRLAKDLPNQVLMPAVAISASCLIRWMGSLRKSVHRASRPC